MGVRHVCRSCWSLVSGLLLYCRSFRKAHTRISLVSIERHGERLLVS